MAKLTTAPSAPLEILAGMQNEAAFGTRKKAIASLVELCGRDGFLAPDGDTVVARAFRRDAEALDQDLIWQGVLAAHRASTPNELLRGVPDPIQRVLRSVKIEAVKDWDVAVGRGFKREMDAAKYEKTDPVLLELVKAEGIEGKEAQKLARLLQAIAITERPHSRRFALAGLAVRAGAIDEARLQAAIERNSIDDLDEICREAEAAYDGSLDGFIDVYRHYHAVTALRRPNAGLNDCLDLEPLLYFDAHDPEQVYVTGEDFWVTVVNLAHPNRALDVKPIARQPAPPEPGPGQS